MGLQNGNIRLKRGLTETVNENNTRYKTNIIRITIGNIADRATGLQICNTDRVITNT